MLYPSGSGSPKNFNSPVLADNSNRGTCPRLCLFRTCTFAVANGGSCIVKSSADRGLTARETIERPQWLKLYDVSSRLAYCFVSFSLLLVLSVCLSSFPFRRPRTTSALRGRFCAGRRGLIVDIGRISIRPSYSATRFQVLHVSERCRTAHRARSAASHTVSLSSTFVRRNCGFDKL